MKEKLFKGKGFNNKWVYGNFYIYNTKLKTAFIGKYNNSNKLKLLYVQVLPETVSEYTGLDDKRNNKIFEGDIVKQTFETSIQIDNHDYDHIWGYYIGEVAIIPSKGICIKNPYQYKEKNGEITNEYKKIKTYKQVVSYRSEVIGNIYDLINLSE